MCACQAERCQDKVDGCINIAVVGNSGVGKSLLINRRVSPSCLAVCEASLVKLVECSCLFDRLRRMRPQAEGWAAVGVNETTREPTMRGPHLLCQVTGRFVRQVLAQPFSLRGIHIRTSCNLGALTQRNGLRKIGETWCDPAFTVKLVGTS